MACPPAHCQGSADRNNVYASILLPAFRPSGANEASLVNGVKGTGVAGLSVAATKDINA